LERLDAGLVTPLTLVAAPAGSGKTTLLGTWYAALKDRDASIAWVSLDSGDNDPARFWRYVLAALERCCPRMASGALSLLEPPRPADIETVLTALLNALTARAGDVVLFLEDYHLITARAVHESVTFLLNHLPPHAHIVIATRADPPLPLARLRGLGLVTELRTSDLRFTIEEATTFWTGVMGLPLQVEDIGILEQRTEGWIAGMQLAALSLQGRSADEVADFIHAFTGSHRHVVDYLTDEVFSRCSEPVQDFLLRTSILDRMSASLCAALIEVGATATAVQKIQELLEELERSNLFVVPLDDRREWYRYHHLFADAMRHRLGQQHHDEVSRHHERAAGWFEQQGFLDEAIEHMLRAGDFERAATLIERAAPALHARGARLTMESWLAALPKKVAQSRPRLAIMYAWMALDDGELAFAEHCLQTAEQTMQKQLEGTGAAGASRNMEGEIAAARAFASTIHGDPVETIAFAEQALKLLDRNNSVIRAVVAMALGRAYMGQRDLGRAARVFDEALTTFRLLDNQYLGLRVMFLRSTVERAGGLLQQAVGTCREALAWSGDDASLMAGAIHVHLADLLREMNDLEGALHHATLGVELTSSLKHPDFRVFPPLMLARVKHARGDLAGASKALERAKAMTCDPEVEPYLPLLESFEARFRLRQGDLDMAARLSEKASSGRNAPWLKMHPVISFAHECLMTTPIQVLIARGRARSDPRPLQTALELLEQQEERAEWKWMSSYRAHLLILRALAHQALGDDALALAALRQALTLGQCAGYVRLFADEGEPMAELLRRVDASGIADDYLNRVAACAAEAGERRREESRGVTIRFHHLLDATAQLPPAQRRVE
jgi:LuxR family maltose regulon positive regulatory protein